MHLDILSTMALKTEFCFACVQTYTGWAKVLDSMSDGEGELKYN